MLDTFRDHDQAHDEDDERKRQEVDEDEQEELDKEGEAYVAGELNAQLGAGAPVQRKANPGGVSDHVMGALREQLGPEAVQRRAVQREEGGEVAEDPAAVQAIAADGVAGAGGALPHLDAIQASFGDAHDLSGVRAHVGGKAGDAADAIGAEAYATGGDVAFARSPDLHTAAHEAAHVVQQQAGVQLKGGVGQAGDGYEREADAVADAVVAGQSAAPLLARHAGGGAAAGDVQRRDKGGGKAPTAGPSEDDRSPGAIPQGNARDAQGRILAVRIEGGRTRIGIGLGQAQGVGVGMAGYIKSDDGMVADFYIEEVGERLSWASVDVTIDQIGDHKTVVVNPSSMPKRSEPVQDVEARIVGVRVVSGRTQITIGRGIKDGARAGMPGYVIGRGGRSIDDFVVVEQYPGHCLAFVNLTVDDVQRNPRVMLNPTGGR